MDIINAEWNTTLDAIDDHIANERPGIPVDEWENLLVLARTVFANEPTIDVLAIVAENIADHVLDTGYDHCVDPRRRHELLVATQRLYCDFCDMTRPEIRSSVVFAAVTFADVTSYRALVRRVVRDTCDLLGGAAEARTVAEFADIEHCLL
jgi:hypothetical protein